MKTVKGQVSLEYLMTYGIAIAIVVIAVAALYSMGIFEAEIEGNETSLNNQSEVHGIGGLVVHVNCDDGVICYFYNFGFAGGMDCTRDDDLVDKYCGENGK